MSLIQKRYGTYLAGFKEEVRRDPDGDFTPRIQKLAAKLRTEEKAREISVVDELFLSLYDMDAPSLRADLTELGTLEPAKKAALSEKQRRPLLQGLYEVLSPYIEKNCRGVVAICKMRARGIGTVRKTYEELLENFKEEVRRDPGGDFAPRIQELTAEAVRRRNERARNVIITLLLNLYEQDTDLIEKVLTRLAVLKPSKKARPSECTDLLPYLCEALSAYIKEDLSDLIAMCERLA